MAREFTCFSCNETHEASWSEEERDQEAEEVFGNSVFADSPMVLVCDDCYQKIMGSFN